MKQTRYWKITVTGTKQACNDHFKLMKSACDVEISEFPPLPNFFDILNMVTPNGLPPAPEHIKLANNITNRIWGYETNG